MNQSQKTIFALSIALALMTGLFLGSVTKTTPDAHAGGIAIEDFGTFTTSEDGRTLYWWYRDGKGWKATVHTAP